MTITTETEGDGHEPYDESLLRALRAGNEEAFVSLIEQYHPLLIRVARNFVPSDAVAEEVAQETWMAVLAGIHSFEGRSSLKWWILRILTNCAKTRGQKERRCVPWSSLPTNEEPTSRAVDPDRFFDESHPLWSGGWCAPPQPFGDAHLLSNETLRLVAAEIERLPEGQRQVIWLREVEGLDADEVCTLLNLSEANQRVLLHRARSRLRAALEARLTPGVLTS
ncbi:MAG: RNA polymerase sigma factor [Myxococcales bacterium]